MAARELLLLGGGIAVGLAVGRFLLPPRTGGPVQADGESGVPLARMADDALFACQQMRPVMLEIRDAARDGRISVGEYVGIAQRVQSLTRRPNPRRFRPLTPRRLR